jgi:prepilin-type N-terminal cleavage/methylation domain-containing protein
MRKQDNHGFTLIEVLLSITIIAILLVSILNAFVNTAKVNAVAKQEQNATTAAQNLMESLKTMTLEGTAIEYTKSGYPEGVILSSHTFDSFEIPSVETTLLSGVVTYSFNPPPGRDVHSYALTDVEINGVRYDALVTLDTATYSKSEYVNTMNNYKMPKLLTINENIVAIIDMENLHATSEYDAEALSYFKSFHATYINAVEAQPTPIPSHTHVSDSLIDTETTKNIIMTFTKDSTNHEIEISCHLEYTCTVDLNDDGDLDTFDSDEIYSGAYSLPTDAAEDSNIYLFYTPSAFALADSTKRDTITIVNPDELTANIHIAYQTSNSITTPLTIKKLTSTGEDTSSNVTVFTNFQGTINSTTITGGKLYDDTTLACRIYKITVAIYPKGTILNNDFSDPYITLTSVKEE